MGRRARLTRPSDAARASWEFRRGTGTSSTCVSPSSAAVTSVPCTPPPWPSSATRSSASTSTRRKIERARRGRGPVLRARPARDPDRGPRVRAAPLHHRHGRGRRCPRALRRRRHPAGTDRCRGPDLRRRRRRRADRRTCPPATSSSASRPCPVGTAARLAAEVSEPSPARRSSGTPSSCARASPCRTPSPPTASSTACPTGEAGETGRRRPRRGLRRGARHRHAPTRRQPAHRRAREGQRQRVPRDEDLVHQRDGRDRRGRRRRRHAARRRDRPRRPHRPQVPERRHRLRRRLPAQGHPRVPGAGERARASGSRWRSWPTSTPSTCAVAPASSSWRRSCSAGSSAASASPCSAWRSSRTPTTSATRRPSTSRPRLHELGAVVSAYDPEAIVTARRVRPELDYVESAAEALAGSGRWCSC